MNAIATDAAALAAHRPQLLRYALLQLRDRAAAEDAVQDTLVAALQGAASFANGSSVRTWLIGILKHKITDHFRRSAREVRLGGSEDDDADEALDRLYLDDGHLRNPPADWGNPEGDLSRREFFATFERCLERLPKRTAQAFVLREIQDKSTEEICQALGISEANCWVMLHRARLVLREALEAEWFAPQGVRRRTSTSPGTRASAAKAGKALMRS
jgi:RNA polymerase sigma-70 factor (ECF subfamily)